MQVCTRDMKIVDCRNVESLTGVEEIDSLMAWEIRCHEPPTVVLF